MTIIENSPDLWKDKLPHPQKDGHKYDRGHAFIYGAPALTGATRLAAMACARVGAGLTSVLSTPDAAPIYKETLPAHIMVRDDPAWWDGRVTARLYGSGGLPCAIDYSKDISTVLDADAINDALPDTLGERYVLTPHEGEFARTFPDITGSKSEMALKAAEKTGAVVVLKGAETIIANAEGQVVVNTHSSPYLASAGTGDVLAGMMCGLCAAGMPPFYAACAAVWMHGEAGLLIGPGLVASDIPEKIGEILRIFA